MFIFIDILYYEYVLTFQNIDSIDIFQNQHLSKEYK